MESLDSMNVFLKLQYPSGIEMRSCEEELYGAVKRSCEEELCGAVKRSCVEL